MARFRRRMAFALACVAAGSAGAQSAASPPAYPQRPIRLIVPVTIGGTTDIVARMVAACLSQALSQQLVIDNRAGAGGIIGTEWVARALPDGHTLSVKRWIIFRA